MAVARPIRFLLLGAFCTILYIIFSFTSSGSPPPKAVPDPDDPGKDFRVDKNFVEPNLESKRFIIRLHSASLADYHGYAVTGEPLEPLRRVEGDNYDPDNEKSARANATLLTLVRNSELDDMLQSMRDLERTFNRKFNYPWLFLNDVPFTEEFKRRISAETKAKVTFGRTLNHAAMIID
jgi:hypothetical protein